MTTSSNNEQVKQSVKSFLENLFKILEDMVNKAQQAPPNSASQNCCDLSQVKSSLNKIKSDFTDESCAIFNQVAVKLDDYKNLVKELLEQRVQPSPHDGMQEAINEITNPPDTNS